MNAEQMIESLLPTREAENGSACMKCMQPNPHLVRCSACLRVKYCSKACQKSDWKVHKPVCKILRVFNQASKEMANATTDAPIEKGKYDKMDKFARFKVMAVASDSTHSSSSSLLGDLPRNNIPDVAWNMAKSLVVRSPCCAICQKTDFDHAEEEISHGAKVEWKCCPRCNNGWCCTQHSDRYLRERHTTEICNTYIKSTNIDRFRYNHTVRQGDRFFTMPENSLSAPLLSFPKSWNEYFKLRMPIEHQAAKRSQLPDEYMPSATYLLSQVTTCLYGMYQHDRDFFTTAEVLTIHVVGPGEFEYEGGSPTCIWEEIMHCLPSVKRMNVIFTGPEGDLSFPLRQIASCPDCTSKGRVRMQGFHTMTYHEYYASEEFISPDFVVAYNTGMFEEYTESWKESLRVLLALDVPCIFTSYNKQEGDADYEVLRDVYARTLTDTAMLNPFRVNIPLVDDGCIDKFFQCNMYHICFRGRTTAT